ncbi:MULTISPECIES: RNA polymerase sigma factor [Ralstonia solanacearum species complex]|uniref:Extracytoplasmic function sigma factor protein n=3 Tax=Ralstonia solanacearum TaxID=305 RepID=A0A7U7JEX6_RALSL|nr:RNA polymerase sigma factor [Ralstonia solanacearum]ATI29295.1 RNA polymerase sigma factor [Ralstonia solanacearum]EAP73335.1 putative sigma factor [Ralstonia solanacearum UW551]KEI31553.1 transcriptional regulator [Ralstonia solanacearum]KFX78277.1 transcriptional regulator [Ralstonia solanacearum]KFX82880.1 transcriptional regulator [Ralstonia solanacearum]
MTMTALHCDFVRTSLMAAFVDHYEELINHVRHRFGDQAFACDVVQDVCVQLLHRPPAEPVCTPLAFLRHLSIHRAIDRWRSDETRAAYAELAGQAASDTDDVDGERIVASRQTVHQVEQVIDGLPARCREVFILHKLHDLSQDEVAVRLSISRNMVAKHLARAMLAMRSISAVRRVPKPRAPMLMAYACGPDPCGV